MKLHIIRRNDIFPFHCNSARPKYDTKENERELLRAQAEFSKTEREREGEGERHARARVCTYRSIHALSLSPRARARAYVSLQAHIQHVSTYTRMWYYTVYT